MVTGGRSVSSRLGGNTGGANGLDRLDGSLEHLIELSRLLQARSVDLMVPCLPVGRTRRHGVRKGIPD